MLAIHSPSIHVRIYQSLTIDISLNRTSICDSPNTHSLPSCCTSCAPLTRNSFFYFKHHGSGKSLINLHLCLWAVSRRQFYGKSRISPEIFIAGAAAFLLVLPRSHFMANCSLALKVFSEEIGVSSVQWLLLRAIITEEFREQTLPERGSFNRLPRKLQTARIRRMSV